MNDPVKPCAAFGVPPRRSRGVVIRVVVAVVHVQGAEPCGVLRLLPSEEEKYILKTLVTQFARNDRTKGHSKMQDDRTDRTKGQTLQDAIEPRIIRLRK